MIIWHGYIHCFPLSCRQCNRQIVNQPPTICLPFIWNSTGCFTRTKLLKCTWYRRGEPRRGDSRKRKYELNIEIWTHQVIPFESSLELLNWNLKYMQKYDTNIEKKKNGETMLWCYGWNDCWNSKIQT